MSGVVILGKDASNNVLKPVEVTSAGLIKCDVSGIALASNQATANSSLGTIATNTADGSTSTLQGTINTSIGTGNTSLASIATNTALGNSNKAGSMSVTIASDEGAISVSAPALSVSQQTIINNASVANGATEVSSVIDMRTSKCVAIYGTMSDTNGEVKLLVGGTSSGTFYEVQSVYISGDFITGDFGIFLDNVGGSYLKISYTNSSGSSKSIDAFAEIKS